MVVAGAFAWGFLAHRNHWFPYKQLRSLVYRTRLGYMSGIAPRTLTGVGPRKQELATLISLPYIAGTRDARIEQSGVVTWDRAVASPGANLFNSTLQGEAQLIDMDGKVLHRWRYPEGTIPQLDVPLQDGRLIGLEQEGSVFCLDRPGHELWRYPVRAHHSIELDDRGHIWTLTRENRAEPHQDIGVRTIEDFIVELTPDGQLIQRISVREILEQSPFAGLIPSFLIDKERDQDNDPPLAFDLIHPNHVEVFDGTLADESPIYKKGNLLVSLRNLNAIAIVDGESKQIVWFWGPGYLFAQHHTTLLANGNILVFNNGVEQSSIVEVDPRTNSVVWEYALPSKFFSRTMGSCQRLPNGNTLITSSETGYVFEVTPDGEIVWTFANPDRKLDLRLSIYRFNRYPIDELGFMAHAQ